MTHDQLKSTTKPMTSESSPLRLPALPRVDIQWFVIGGTVALAAWLSLVPVAFLVWQSFLTAETAVTPATFTWENYGTAYFSAETFRLLGNSVAFGVGSSAVAFVSGTFFAWVNERTNTPFKSMFFALSLIPLVIPAILFTVSWILLASPKIGIINVVLQDLFAADFVFVNIYSLGGMIFVDGMHQSPLAFLLMTAAFRAMDPALEEFALMSGATVPQIARRITLKLAWPAALAALLILFVRAVESFEVPALLGLPVGIEVYTSSIYQAIQRYPSEVGLASAYAVTLLLIASLCIYAQSRVASEAGKFSTVTGKGFRPRLMNIGAWRYLTVAIFVTYFMIIVALPFLVLAWCSLQKFYSAPTLAAMKSLTFDAYRAVFDYPEIGTVIWNTAVLAIVDRHHHHADDVGACLDRGPDQAARSVGARLAVVAAAGVSRPRARSRHHDLLPSRRYRRVWHALDHAHRLCHPLHALRHALQHDVHARAPQGARGNPRP